MDSLKGHLLIAMPSMLDERFSRSVIYLIEHDAHGAMGLIVNKPLDLTFGDVLTDLDLDGTDDAPLISKSVREKPVYNGGPVERARGFVLHSADYFDKDSSVKIDSNIVLSANREILSAIAQQQNQPEQSLFALGYAGWEAAQLEDELAANSWLTVAAEPSVLFETNQERRYQKSLALLGLTPANLSAETGFA